MKDRPYIKFFLIALFVIFIDQGVKLAVKLNMQYDQEIPLIGDVVKIHFLENPGAAFGVTVSNLAGIVGGAMTPETGKLILSLFSLVAMCVIGVVLYRVSYHKTLLPYLVALIFGGAIGNIIDRVFYGAWFSAINNYKGGIFHGRVVDMIYFDLWEGFIPDAIPGIGGAYMSFWPVFNIADSAISIGIIMILIFQSRLLRTEEENESKEVTPPAKTDNSVAITG